ncbi:bacterial transferase hexapeptide family protein [Chlamydia ibidis]|uniref:Bacterial transferase hexapeptide family protein n=2 Tax=Chlamydia ibidis TaxID=1405396 RepID=S7J2Y4_9CHLA|nr:transferase [Chlamydia ibidis]EPP34749.1 bacterial transferase hexapeptide family protein [Chlamydia ibidis]EQM62904.1 bacterial transferase hexapeptide family protein [Chlamydia ibidis 10-1398/6]
MTLASSLFSPEDFPFPELITEADYAWDILSLIKKKLSSHIFSGIHGTVESGVYLKNPETIEISKDAYVESGAYIVGPCILGPGTQVRHGAYLRGGVITGSCCVIGHCTEVKNAYFGHYAKAAHFAYIGDSVLSAEVNLGAGVRCANFRLDGKEIFAIAENEKIPTNLRKVGAFLGKKVSVGCNVVINPGHCIPAYSKIHPGKVI